METPPPHLPRLDRLEADQLVAVVRVLRFPVALVGKRRPQQRQNRHIVQAGVALLAKGLVEVHFDRQEPADLQFGCPLGMPGGGAFQGKVQADAGDLAAARPQRQFGADHGDEIERVELEQHVEGHKTVDAERARLRQQLDPGPELDGVGGDRKVGLQDQARVIPGGQLQRQAPEDRQVERRRVVSGVEAAHREQEIGIVSPASAARPYRLSG